MIPSIEPPFTFLQEPSKMFGRNAVETPQMPFRLIPEIFYPVDMVSLFHKLP